MDPYAHTFQTSKFGHQRKSLELAKNKELDRSVYTWFIHARLKGTPVSGVLLQERAKHFYDHAVHKKCNVLKQKST